MSLRIRCASCRRGTSGKHSLCKECRGSSSADRSSRSSRSNRSEPGPSYTSADRYGEYSYPSGDAAYYGNSDATGYQNRSAEGYRDAGRYLGRNPRDVECDIANGYPYAHERDTRQANDIPGVSYVRPRVHPYQNRYDYISANVQYVYPSHNGGYPTTQRYGAPSSHAGHGQPASGSYYTQPSQAPGQPTSGQRTQVNYVYSGTEGPDGEIID